MSDARIKLQRKGQIVIPRSLREEAGVVEGGQFLITPQVTINSSIVVGRGKDSKHGFRELAQVVGEIRQEAKEKGLDTMPMKEINRAVAGARRDLKKKTRTRPAK